MATGTKTKSESILLSRLFRAGAYEVPWHQRRYDWKKEHVVRLLQDIDDAQKSKSDCYFLGSILLIPQAGTKWHVNDGQQRMLTYSLICARFLRLFHEVGDNYADMALRILFEYDGAPQKNFGDADNLQPRLIPIRDNKSRFNLIIRGHDIGQNGKLTTAWQEIDKFVSAFSLQNAHSYFDFLTEKVEVCRLEIPHNVDPNMVFETLNFRGKLLDDFDLIRNHIYSFFNNESEAERRETLKENFDDNLQARLVSGNSDKVTEYARCYLQCEYGFLPQQQLYRKVKERMAQNISSAKGKSADYVFNLASRLGHPKNSQLFLSVARPNMNADYIAEFDKNVQPINKKRSLEILLTELQSYKVTQPLIFALLSKYEHDSIPAPEIYRHIKNVTSFVMRTALAKGKFEPSLFESDIADMARQIMRTKTTDELSEIDIIGRLSGLGTIGIIDDKRFISIVKDVEIRAADKARRFLFAINTYMQTDFDILQFNNTTLEHILPKSDTHWQKWEGFGEEHKEWVHRLGNLTLLGKQDNKPYAKDNASIAAKCAIFEHSSVAMSKNLAHYKEWTPESIEKRQEAMAEKAAKIWNFKSGKNSK